MSLPQFAWKTMLGLSLGLAAPALVRAQSYTPQGVEYAIAGLLPGDQVSPALSLKTSGGFLVWQDNITDGEGLGLSALRLDSSLSGTLSPFRVNQQAALDQERPQVSLLKEGGAVFVWQGGRQGFQRIYARFMTVSNTWETGDVLVNTFTNQSQVQPRVATLTNGTVVVVWGSFHQRASDSLQDVYAQRFSPAGQKLGGEFPVNQFSIYNQRTPALAALSDGRFLVVWVSEQQRFEESVDVYARFFDANGTALGGEFLINTGTNLCAHPTVAVAAGGGFLVAWAERNVAVRSNGWDIVSRVFSSTGVGGTACRVNTRTYGDQFAPQASAVGADYLVVWTSLGQDGSREGVYGQFLTGSGALSGPENRVHTTTASQQIHPAVASDGHGRYLVAWTSFGGGMNSFDLYAQRYATVLEPLPPPDAPYVSVLSSSALSVTWPVLAGFNVAQYEVYADGAVTATAAVTNNWWTMTNLAPSSAHSFRLAFVLADGRRSPLSPSASATTYGALTYGGIPYEWMILYWGTDIFSWASPYADSDGDGVSNRNEFLAGTNPLDANSVLKQRLQRTPQGLFLTWNTQPGLLYQVQASANLGAWQNVGGLRFAAGYMDSMFVGGGPAAYYRVLRVR